MAAIRKRRSENVAGSFYVDSTCIDCDQCRQIAPASFFQAGDQSAVFRQPVTAEETRAALEALVTCPVGSIGTTTKLDVRLGLEPGVVVGLGRELKRHHQRQDRRNVHARLSCWPRAIPPGPRAAPRVPF